MPSSSSGSAERARAIAAAAFIVPTALSTAVAALLLGASAASAASTTKRQAFCNAALAADAITGEPSSAAAAKVYAAKFVPIMATASKNAVPALAQPLRTVTDVFTKAATTGAGGGFETPAFGQAVSKLEGWVYDNCGFKRVSVTAADFTYTGVPANLPAGNTSFSVKNTGKEFHEFIVMRRKDGVNDAVVDIFKAGPESAATKLDQVGAGSAVAPGTTSGLVSTLTPGRYVYVCFIPSGVKHDGPSHFAKGMYGEFTVA